MKFIDLCCGIGGFHQAMKNMGMTCVMASDIDKDCRDNYELNYGLKPEGDLTKIQVKNIPSFDILCAGFPCQPFSKAGKQVGFDDNRGNLFFEICKIIEHHRPKYLILENVRNLASHDDGNTWNVIRRTIREMGYHTYDEPVILNSLYFGVPQSRERVVILCKRTDLGDLPELPIIGKKRVKKTCLSSIVEEKSDKKYNIKGKFKVVHEVWDEFLNIMGRNNIAVPRFPLWTDWWDKDGPIPRGDKLTPEEYKEKQTNFYQKYKNWIDKNREFYEKHQGLLEGWLYKSRENPLWKGAVRKMEWQCKEDHLNMKQVLWSPRGSGIRIKNINYSPTLVAMTSMIPVYGPAGRQLTPRECARLQSFPDDYIIHPSDTVAYKQFGNAVNVKMMERSARFLLNEESLFE